MKNINHSLLFWIFLVPIIYISYLWAYAVNIPWMDDIDAFVDSYLIIQDATTWQTALAEFADPNNEHRMILSKVISYLLVALTGQLNFRLLILVHNAFLFFLLFQIFRLKLFLPKISPIYWLSFLLFLLTPQYHLTSNWSITGWQTISVLLFGFLSLKYLTSLQVYHFSIAVVFAIITTFGYGNGPLIWFVGGVILLLQQRWRDSLSWSIFAILAISLYFFRHTTGRNSEAFLYFKTHVSESLRFFFIFLGSNGDWFKHLPENQRALFPFMWGVVLIGAFGYGLFIFGKKYMKDRSSLTSGQWTLLGFLLLLLANAVLVATLRANLGFEVMVVSNYRVYSAFTLAVLLIGLATLLPSKAMVSSSITPYIVLALATIFYISSWNISLPELRTRKQFLQAHAYNQAFNGVGLGALNNSPFYTYLQEKIGEVVKRGVYSYPSYFPTDLQEQMKTAVSAPAIQWDSSNRRVSTNISSADACYFIFYTDKHLYLIPTKRVYMPRYTFFTTATHTFQTDLLPTFFQQDTYQLGLLIEKDGKQTVLTSEEQVVINF